MAVQSTFCGSNIKKIERWNFNQKEKNYSKLSFSLFGTACNKNRWMCNKLAERTMRFIISEEAIPREKKCWNLLQLEVWTLVRKKNHKIEFTMGGTRGRCEGLRNIKFTIFFFEHSEKQQQSRMAFLILKLSTHTQRTLSHCMGKRS
jgi:hypothetical protein